MPLSQDQIKHIAKLSRLELTSEETQEYEHTLEEVVNYIDRLQNIPSEAFEHIPFSSECVAPLRDDVVRKSEISQQELLGCTGQKVIASQIALPNIMK